MLNHKLCLLWLAAGLLTINAHAFEIAGSQAVKIRTTTPRSKFLQASKTSLKTVYLKKIKMNANERSTFLHPELTTDRLSARTNPSLPASANVGMNNVPVLDQGMHGTCATFATIAALDALLNKADYISELCNLELGLTLEKDSYRPSGWEGSYGALVLEQIMGNGIISKEFQRTNGCAGKKEYPTMSEQDKGTPITLSEFHEASEDLSEKFYWEPILNITTRLLNSYDHGYNPEVVLSEVKKSLSRSSPIHDERLTAGILIPIENCQLGACASYHVDNDTWVMTHEMQYGLDNQELYGHDMVITAYDDNARVVDNEGMVHTGLLTLRNSWGSEAGDKGNYYMSYDFFKKYVIEIQRIVALKEGRTPDINHH